MVWGRAREGEENNFLQIKGHANNDGKVRSSTQC